MNMQTTRRIAAVSMASAAGLAIAAPLGRWIAGVGIAGATVQVIGLSRWVLLIPGVSDDAMVPALAVEARHTFELLHFWLGTRARFPSPPGARPPRQHGTSGCSQQPDLPHSATTPIRAPGGLSCW